MTAMEPARERADDPRTTDRPRGRRRRDDRSQAEPEPADISPDAGPGPFDLLTATEDTVVATLDRLRSEGFVAAFVLEPEDIPPGLWCRACGRRHLPTRTTVVEVHRFEGPTSPEDEALLLALVCPRCGAKGTAVTAYGPSASGNEAELLRALAARATATLPTRSGSTPTES